MAVKHPFDAWTHLPLLWLYDMWAGAGMGKIPLPWETPPLDPRGQPVTRLLVLTNTYKLYDLPSYKQFYRIMYREDRMRLVDENDQSEVIIEVYAWTPPPSPPAALPDNVIKFPRRMTITFPGTYDNR